ncbi:MAG: DNA-binding protein [Actinomycetota bacterium]|nr:DNA-binding protein [Actinomycetota bacterium]
MTAARAVQTAKAVARGSAMTIAEVLGHESALMDLPTFFKACGMAESTGYQVAAAGDLPIEVIRLGRRRYVRTVDAWTFLGLNNSDAAGYQPTASSEQIKNTTK